MLGISTRGRKMPASPIRKLVPFAEAAKKAGTFVHHLNIGQPDIKTPKAMLEAYHSLSEDIIEYGPSSGLTSYRKGLANYYRLNGIDVVAEDIIITTGGSEAIIFAMMATMNPGDEIIITEPFYTNYNGLSEQTGVHIVPVTSYIESNFSLPSVQEFEKKITSKTKAILICNPGNPTGYIYTEEELEALKKLVLKHNLFFLSDEVYREFVYGGNKVHSVMSLKGVEEQTILLDSISKRYSACGARVGALVSKNKKIIDVALRLGQARLCPPTVEQLVAEAALKTPKSYFDAVKAEYQKRRDTVIKHLEEIPNVIFGRPKGAFYLIAKLPVDNADYFCQWLLKEFSYKNQTVMLAPANGFYATEGLGVSEVRIAYVRSVEEINQAMACLKVALNVYQNT